MNATDNQSLLVFIHNWRYHHLARKHRPPQAAPGARLATYAIGALMLIGIGFASGLRRRDSPRDLVIITGLLIGLAFVVSPIVHNFYYPLLLPLVAALLHQSQSEVGGSARTWKLPLPVLIFMLTDIVARLPTIGGSLRDWGLPLLSMVWMLGAGAKVLLKQESINVSLQVSARPATATSCPL
jgi:hypothetical protein